MHGGELVVTGSYHVEIILPEHPDKVTVHFVGHEIVVPCDNHHHDDLSWHLTKEKPHHHHHYSSRYILTISWRVSGVREIVWKVCY